MSIEKTPQRVLKARPSKITRSSSERWPGSWHDGWIAWLTNTIDKDGNRCWYCPDKEYRWMKGKPND